jgi:peptide/nickel transport system substrate-binding protein
MAGSVRATAVLAVVVALSACTSHHTAAPNRSTVAAVADGGSITIAAEHELGSFNTNTSVDDSPWANAITRLIWPSFSYQAPDGSVQLGPMAAGPPTVVTRDPFTVEWKIAANATWSDGVPVTSDDLAYYYESCNGRRDPGEPKSVDCVSTDGYDQITKFTEIDSKTAEATFSSPVAEYASLFDHPMPPAHIARQRGVDAWANAFVSSPIASAGPYMLQSWQHGTSLTLVRNPKFWGQAPHLDTITFRFFTDPTQEPAALGNDEVNVVAPDPASNLVGAISSVPGIRTVASVGPEAEHLTFNFRNPVLADAMVRRAIALGIDRHALAPNVLENRLFLSGQAGYVDDAGALDRPNAAEAQRMLDADGWVVGTDGIRVKDGQPLQLRIITTGSDAAREKTERLLRAQLRAIGVDLVMKNRPESSALDVIFGGARTASEWDIALFAWVHTAAPALDTAPVYQSGAESNPGAYNNPQVDELFAQAIGELDAGRRRTLLDQIDRLLWTDLPDIPLYQRPTFVAYSARYTNLVDNPNDEDLTWNAEQWGLRK